MIEIKHFENGSEAVVLLHEGLGSLSTVADFASKLPFYVTAYSRLGYGLSTGKPVPWSVNYMDEEAIELSHIIKELNQSVHLIGHSDGASIAAIYAASHSVKSLTLIAPHFVVEDISISSIQAAKTAYEHEGLKAKLARHHSNPDNAFYGWNGAWLNPAFRDWTIEKELESISAPVLIIQGENDQYGTVKQIEIAQTRLKSAPQIAFLKNVNHNPMREAEDETLKLITAFISRHH